MGDEPHPEPEFTHSSTSEAESPSAHARPASGMFSHSQHFTVTGGTFANVTNHTTAPSLPSDFRMIPMGDIDLRHQIRVAELRVDEFVGVVNSQSHSRACLRRMHSAKALIASRKSRVTVAIYEGDGAEGEWRQDVAKYMRLRQVSRHPNIVQVCGAASSNGIHATLFNDDLTPLREVLDRHRESPLMTVYIYACCNQDFREAFHYIYSVFQSPPFYCAYWIRRSTGRLCTELTPASDNLRIYPSLPKLPGLSRMGLLSACVETISTFIDSLTLEQYNLICDCNLGQYRHFHVSTSTTVNLSGVFHCLSDAPENSIEIAFLPSVAQFGFSNWTTSEGSTGEVMPNGWTRYFSIG
ncbi:hypothetical protein MSAN_00124200 [Mycena sanguinolenta]|uniref:Protein kinase domain-containing protein n=1 Tax=Mycena sanguinolenta TaxID=230812 RepID=A0A8H6ZKB3_9AGAR|nr:hypothetical protein MSAN_00124200 [Mycena sanguinolenta]